MSNTVYTQGGLSMADWVLGLIAVYLKNTNKFQVVFEQDYFPAHEHVCIVLPDVFLV